MIEKLGYGKACIFDVELSEDNSELEMTEACDMYYTTYLTKDQVIELANDFLRLAEAMTVKK